MANDRSLEPNERTRATHNRAGSKSSPEADLHIAPHPLLALQQQVGNAQVARMLAQRAAVDEEEPLQPKREAPEVGLEGGPISDGLAGRIQAKKGGGSPLAEGTRATMESHFGTSFEDVRVHSDGESGVLNRSLGAKAFTTGSDVFLGAGASSSDHNLMAHELTHVVQQRSMSGGGRMTVGPAGDSYEQEADAAASKVSSGAAAAQRKPEQE